ncbi:MAG: helix-turn-helix domain-containing protein [Minisyncoccia bacterium]
MLTPLDIRALRKRHGLTRKELERLTGFGEASIKRWERGVIIQNESTDTFLRLIDDAEVLDKLRQLRKRLGY